MNLIPTSFSAYGAKLICYVKIGQHGAKPMSIGLYKTCSNFWHSVCLDYKLMPKFIDAGFYWNNKASIDKFGPALNKNL